MRKGQSTKNRSAAEASESQLFWTSSDLCGSFEEGMVVLKTGLVKARRLLVVTVGQERFHVRLRVNMDLMQFEAMSSSMVVLEENSEAS